MSHSVKSNNKPLSRPKFVEAMEDLNLGIKCSRPKAAAGEQARPYIFFGIGERDTGPRVRTVENVANGRARAA
jgi:hypothetical protein